MNATDQFRAALEAYRVVAAKIAPALCTVKVDAEALAQFMNPAVIEYKMACATTDQRKLARAALAAVERLQSDLLPLAAVAVVADWERFDQELDSIAVACRAILAQRGSAGRPHSIARDRLLADVAGWLEARGVTGRVKAAEVAADVLSAVGVQVPSDVGKARRIITKSQ